MAAFLASVPGVDSFIRKLVIEEKRSHLYISEELKKRYPTVSRGLSARTVRRYCADNGIHKTSRLNEDAIDRLVRTNIERVSLNACCNHSCNIIRGVATLCRASSNFLGDFDTPA